uniref:Uncharacterized protein n=1 Tax=Anguilla anguilla TaxID=7936 RepID=A0A0E9SRT6_ANGAN
MKQNRGHTTSLYNKGWTRTVAIVKLASYLIKVLTGYTMSIIGKHNNQ